MRLTLTIKSLLALTISGSLTRADSFPTFNNEIIFQSPPDYTVPGTRHAKTLELADGSLLATWENYSPEPPLVYFPIYKSIDGALTWHEISRVTYQVNNWGLRYQLFLYLLPEPIADLPANSILLAGNSVPTKLANTQIDMTSTLGFKALFAQSSTWHQNSVLVRHWHMAHIRSDEAKANVHSILLCCC